MLKRSVESAVILAKVIKKLYNAMHVKNGFMPVAPTLVLRDTTERISC